MTNSWSMLYDEILKMDDNTLNIGTHLPGAEGDDHINLNMSKGNIDIISTTSTSCKYSEEEIVKELLQSK